MIMPPTIPRNIGIRYHALLLRGSDGSDTLRCAAPYFRKVATRGTSVNLINMCDNVWPNGVSCKWLMVIREMILWEFSIYALNGDKNVILSYDVRYVSFAAFGLLT